MNQCNLKQITREPTHYTEGSFCLISLCLFRNPANVLYCGVIDPFIPDQIRYRCPILVLLKFIHPKPKTIKPKVWNYELADFSKNCVLLSEYDLINNLESDTNIDSYVILIIKAIFKPAKNLCRTRL